MQKILLYFTSHNLKILETELTKLLKEQGFIIAESNQKNFDALYLVNSFLIGSNAIQSHNSSLEAIAEIVKQQKIPVYSTSAIHPIFKTKDIPYFVSYAAPEEVAIHYRNRYLE